MLIGIIKALHFTFPVLLVTHSLQLRRNLNKSVFSGVVVLAFGVICWGVWTDFFLALSPATYFSQIFQLDLPANAKNVKIFRTGMETPRMEFSFPKEDFPKFKQMAVGRGYISWQPESYDAQENSTLFEKVVMGTSKGSTGLMEKCQIRRLGASFRIFYDYNSETLIALKFRN